MYDLHSDITFPKPKITFPQQIMSDCLKRNLNIEKTLPKQKKWLFFFVSTFTNFEIKYYGVGYPEY